MNLSRTLFCTIDGEIRVSICTLISHVYINYATKALLYITALRLLTKHFCIFPSIFYVTLFAPIFFKGSEVLFGTNLQFCQFSLVIEKNNARTGPSNGAIFGTNLVSSFWVQIRCRYNAHFRWATPNPNIVLNLWPIKVLLVTIHLFECDMRLLNFTQLLLFTILHYITYIYLTIILS